MSGRILSFVARLTLALALFASAWLTTPILSAAQSPASDWVLARAYYHSPEDLAQITAVYDVWEKNAAESYLLVYLSPQQLTQLRSLGIDVEVDTQRTAEINAPRPVDPEQKAGIPGYACYRTVEETYATLDTLKTNYPSMVQTSVIGSSWEKTDPGGNPGYDIRLTRLSNFALGTDKPKFFLMAAIHAREYATAEIATRFAETLLQNYNVDPNITALLDLYEIQIVTHANPDGRKRAEAGSSWRKNVHPFGSCSADSIGVDLNRNSSFHWGGAGASTNPCDLTYRGPSASSEPETQTVQTYVASVFPDLRGPALTDAAPVDYEGLFITLHSYSELILWPWGDVSTPAPNAAGLSALGQHMAYYNQYTPQQSVALYPTTGATDDWSYGELGLPSYTFEVGTNFFQSCSSFESTIWPDNRDALLYAFKAARRPYQVGFGPEITGLAFSANHVEPGAPLTLTAVANDTLTNGGESQAIQAARYSFDLASWEAGAELHAFSAADGTFNTSLEALTAAVDTSGLYSGRHKVYIEGQDALGYWGVPSVLFLDVAALPYSVSLSPASAAQKGAPGQVMQYNLTVANYGLNADTYDLALSSSPSWGASATASMVGPLAPGASTSVSVSVPVPANAVAPSSGTTTLVVHSRGQSSLIKSATLTTSVFNYQVGLTPENASKSGAPGGTVSYTLTVANQGEGLDTFNVGVQSAAGWTVTAPATVGPMLANTTFPLNISVTVPAGSVAPASGQTTVTLTSQRNPARTDASTLTSSVYTYNLTLTSPGGAAHSGINGQLVEYELLLKNTGNGPDTFTISALTTPGWETIAPTTVGPVGANGQVSVWVNVRIPAGSVPPASAATVVTATSQGNPARSQTVELTTSLYGDHVQLSPAQASRFGVPAQVIELTLTVTNDGARTDTFDLSALSANGWTVALNTPVTGVLTPGSSQTITLHVTLPAAVSALTRDSITVTATSRHNPLVKAISLVHTGFEWLVAVPVVTN